MATYLITGVAGFIGSHLADALLARGHSVRGLDNLTTGAIANVPQGVDFSEIDLADPSDSSALVRVCRGVDAILHQAALPSVQRSIEDPLTSHHANIKGTLNLLEAARTVRAAGSNHGHRVLYAASSSAYGNQPGFPRVESMPPQPLAPYAVQKLTGELYMQSYARVYGPETAWGMVTVCLRYFNIFGPRQAPDSPYSGVIAKFALQMLRAANPGSSLASGIDSEPVTLHGDGEQTRDFTFVENVVRANLLALEAPAQAISGRIFNIASGERHSLNHTFRTLAQLTGYAAPPQYTQPRSGDVRDSLADIGAARQAFGYEPTVNFETGLARTVAWYRQHLESVNIREVNGQKARS